MTSQQLVGGAMVGRLIHVRDIGVAKVTVVLRHELHCKITDGKDVGEVFCFPFRDSDMAEVLEWVDGQ